MSEPVLEDEAAPEETPEFRRRVAGMAAFMRRRNPHIEQLHEEAKAERAAGNEAKGAFKAGTALGLAMLHSLELEDAAAAMGYAPSPSPVVEVSESPELALLRRIVAEYERDEECDLGAIARMIEEGSSLIAALRVR